MQPIINAIFSGPSAGDTHYAGKMYAREAKMTSVGLVVNFAKRVALPKYPRHPPINFIKEEFRHLIHPYIDAVVVELDIANHRVMWNLIDTGSLAYVLFVKMTLIDKSL